MASFLIAFKALLLLSAARWSSVLGAPVSSENDQPETDREQYTTGPSDDGLDIDKDLLDRDAKGGFGDRWKQTRSFLEDHVRTMAQRLLCPRGQADLQYYRFLVLRRGCTSLRNNNNVVTLNSAYDLKMLTAVACGAVTVIHKVRCPSH